jgi:hypothetical protein
MNGQEEETIIPQGQEQYGGILICRFHLISREVTFTLSLQNDRAGKPSTMGRTFTCQTAQFDNLIPIPSVTKRNNVNGL